MVARKKTAAKKGLAPAADTSMATIEQQLRNMAANQDAALGVSSATSVNIQSNGAIKLPNGVISEDPVALVIIDWVPFRTHYESPFSSTNPTPPDCWAFGEAGSIAKVDPAKAHISEVHSRLMPSELITNPMHDNCYTCPMNNFGTSRTGKGKGCNERYRLAVCAVDDPDGPLWAVNVMVTSKAAFETYVRGLKSKQSLQPVQVITFFGVDTSGTQNRWAFEAGGENPNVRGHFTRFAEAQLMLKQEYQQANDEQAPPKTGGRRAKKKTAA